MRQSYIAVLDVGKTNKKALILDAAFRVCDSIYEQFPVIAEQGENGAELHYERSDETADWFIDCLARLGQRYGIAAIGITTHGATCACLQADGSLAMPVLSYTTRPDDGFQQRFHDRFGDPRSLHRQYRTPFVAPLVNAGRMLVFIQEHFPHAWERTRWVLNLPQFFAYRLTGAVGAEATMWGCHTYCWDFDRADYSDFVDRARLRDRLPDPLQESLSVPGPLLPAVVTRTGLSADTPVVLGIHDSNASLLPYLVHNPGRFVLCSTGTWCVAMCPTTDTTLSEEDLDSGAFYNANVFRQPVKTAIQAGGMEHDRYRQWFDDRHGDSDYPAFDHLLLQQVVSDRRAFVLPNVQPGTGPFPASRMGFADDRRRWPLEECTGGAGPQFLDHRGTAFTALGLSLALQSARQLRMVGATDGMPIYIEGGFRKNRVYCQVLAHCFPLSTVAITDMPEATSVGAAMLATAAAEGIPLSALAQRFAIQETVIDRLPLSGLEAYAQAFEAWVGDASSGSE
jgi:L-fuculokinase